MTIELITAPFFGDNIPAYLIDNIIYYIWDNLDWDTINGISSKYIKYVNPNTLDIYTTIPAGDYYTCISWIGLIQNLKPKVWDLDTAVICKLVDNKMIPLTEEELKGNLDLDNLYLESQTLLSGELPTTLVSDNYRKETEKVIREIQNSSRY